MRKAKQVPAPQPSNLLKHLLRLVEFASHRQVNLVEIEGIAFLQDHLDAGSKLKLHMPAFELGLSDGLYRVLPGGALTLDKSAKAFLARQKLVADGKTSERAHQQQHQLIGAVNLRADNGAITKVMVNQISSPLQALSRIKDRAGHTYFSREALAAGERLALDFHRGQLNPRITSSWEPRLEMGASGARNSAADLSDGAASARQRFNAALQSIGPELNGVVVDICCFEKGLELVERERQWPARSAKLMLRTGLDILARHYGLGPRQHASTRSWQAREHSSPEPYQAK